MSREATSTIYKSQALNRQIRITRETLAVVGRDFQVFECDLYRLNHNLNSNDAKSLWDELKVKTKNQINEILHSFPKKQRWSDKFTEKNRPFKGISGVQGASFDKINEDPYGTDALDALVDSSKGKSSPSR